VIIRRLTLTPLRSALAGRRNFRHPSVSACSRSRRGPGRGSSHFRRDQRPNTFAQICRSTLLFSLAVRRRRTIHFGELRDATCPISRLYVHVPTSEFAPTASTSTLTVRCRETACLTVASLLKTARPRTKRFPGTASGPSYICVQRLMAELFGGISAKI
jgi:hypothetical protein